MNTLETWELFSYVVTVIGFPLAIFVFAYEQRRERENEDESVYQLLSDNYDIKMTSKERRRWLSWEDYMPEWCRRADFRRLLPQLLKGEDPEFVTYIQSLPAREGDLDQRRESSCQSGASVNLPSSIPVSRK